MKTEKPTKPIKTAHVIALWGRGGRWRWRGVKMLEIILSHELSLDYGAPMDLILVNAIDDEPSPGYEQYVGYLNDLDERKTKNGEIKVFHRKNIGISNGSFDFAFQQHVNDYDYWIFSEDDRVIIANGVMAEVIRIMKADPKCGLVALNGMKRMPVWQQADATPGCRFDHKFPYKLPDCPAGAFYARGSQIGTSTKIIKKSLILDLWSEYRDSSGKAHLPFCARPAYSRREPAAWTRATNDFSMYFTRYLGLGLKTMPYPKTLSVTSHFFPPADWPWRWGGSGVSVTYLQYLLALRHKQSMKDIDGYKEWCTGLEDLSLFRKEVSDYIKWYDENRFDLT